MTQGTPCFSKAPQTSKGDLSKQPFKGPFFQWDEGRCGCYEWIDLERMWSEATCIVIIPVSTLCTPPLHPLILNELGSCRTERALKIWHLRGKSGTITLLIPHPLPTLPKKKKKKDPAGACNTSHIIRICWGNNKDELPLPFLWPKNRRAY